MGSFSKTYHPSSFSLSRVVKCRLSRRGSEPWDLTPKGFLKVFLWLSVDAWRPIQPPRGCCLSCTIWISSDVVSFLLSRKGQQLSQLQNSCFWREQGLERYMGRRGNRGQGNEFGKHSEMTEVHSIHSSEAPVTANPGESMTGKL